jgi:hypothetical protein
MPIKFRDSARSAALVIALNAGCGTHDALREVKPASAATGLQQQDERDVTVQQGRWRSYPPAILNDYHVALSHVLVSHRTAVLSEWQGRWPWLQAWPAPERSREDALSEARSLSDTLQRSPKQFEAIAQQRSDDLVTRPFGGSLGVIRAPNVAPELLDVYEKLKADEVSEPIETAAGFHIVKRLAIPREQILWARCITLRYAGASGFTRDAVISVRSREEAADLAQEILLRARAEPSRFSELVDQYSEDYFASAGGEMGPLSNLAGTNDVASRLALQQLRPMQISDVLDESRGFVILQRLPDRSVEVRSYEPLFISFDEVASMNGSSVERSRLEAQKLAEAIAGELASDPTTFERRARQLCEGRWCRGEPILSDGSFDPVAYRALDELAPGAVAAHPILTPAGYMVFRRSPELPGPLRSPRRIFSLEETDAQPADSSQVPPG